MLRGALLVVACGCDAVYGIGKANLVDAPVPIDAPPPPMCPAHGTTLSFSKPRQLVFDMPCNPYTPSEDLSLVIGYCPAGLVQAAGLGAALEPVTLLPADASSSITFAELAPEGDRLIVRANSTQTSVTSFRVYTHGTGATWNLAETLPVTTSSSTDHFTPPSRRSAGLRLMLWTSGDLHELDGTNGWAEIRMYTAADLGVAVVQYPSLTPDGLRLTFTGRLDTETTMSLWYTDRPDLTSSFGPAIKVSNDFGFVFMHYLEEDCGALIFTTLSEQLVWSIAQ